LPAGRAKKIRIRVELSDHDFHGHALIYRDARIIHLQQQQVAVVFQHLDPFAGPESHFLGPGGMIPHAVAGMTMPVPVIVTSATASTAMPDFNDLVLLAAAYQSKCRHLLLLV
jgi:hypothetical protein